MARRITRLTVTDLGQLPDPCRACLFWELSPVDRDRACGNEAAAKAEWVDRVLREWGPCGRIAYVDDVYAGHLLWAPPSYVPGSDGFATAPISEDAVQLVSGYVDPQFRQAGIGKALVHAMLKDLHRRGDVRAVEAFADLRGTEGECVLPATFLASLGFTLHRPHLRYPRMRMDMRSLVGWKAEIEAALERLLPSRLRAPISPPTRQVGPPAPVRREVHSG